MSEVAARPGVKQPKKGWFTINVALANDQEPVKIFVGADGKDFLIERGKDVCVPPNVLSVLDDAVKTVTEPDPHDETKTINVDRKRFAYTIVQAH